MRVIIVDDEPEIVEDLKETISEYEDFEIAGSYINPLAALENIAETRPHCAFLDIEMPGMSGIDLAERLLTIDPRMVIVFITAFNHYATQAFEVNAIDYVLKPIHPARFKKTVERLTKIQTHSPPDTYSKVRLRTFGSFDVLLDDKPIKWSRSKARELLAYLLNFEGHKKEKYTICEDLWPDYEPKRALAHLQTAMCSLRKSLGDVGRQDIRIEFSEESYALFLGNVSWDIREFEALYAKIKITGDPDLAAKAQSLFHGDYMGSEGWSWSSVTAESLARKYETLLQGHAEERFKIGHFQEAAEAALTLAQRHPVDAGTQLLLAQAAHAAGGTAGLRRQLKLLQTIFRQAYDAELEPEVLAYCMQQGVYLN